MQSSDKRNIETGWFVWIKRLDRLANIMVIDQWKPAIKVFQISKKKKIFEIDQQAAWQMHDDRQLLDLEGSFHWVLIESLLNQQH